MKHNSLPKRIDIDLKCSICKEIVGQVTIQITDADPNLLTRYPSEVYVARWQNVAEFELAPWHEECQKGLKY